MTTYSPKLLVLGGPDSGKSTYRAQLYQRIEHQEGELRLVKSVGDTSALDADVGRLVRGLQPLHTNLDIYHSSTFVVEDRMQCQFSIEFADYGGEQVQRIGESNSMSAAWVERARHSSAWLLFLRIDQLRSMKSFMSAPLQIQPRPEADGSVLNTEQSAEFGAIETLQRLLFVRGASFRHKLTSPRLGIFLSCWDELVETEASQPAALVLEQRAPLLSKFVASNWHSDCSRIWGLSSTERKLPESTPDLAFARVGPQQMGYTVAERAVISRDLTVPISWLMQPS